MKVGLITNSQASLQHGAIEALRIQALFDTTLVSETDGVRKPDRAFVERGVARFEMHSTECCYVGDNPLVDVAGAVAAGMKAIWKNVHYWPAPDEPVPRISELSELLHLV